MIFYLVYFPDCFEVGQFSFLCVYIFPFNTHGTVRAFTACEYNILDNIVLLGANLGQQSKMFTSDDVQL